MKKQSTDPLTDFKDKIREFASGERRGIRNPFVILPVKPPLEKRLILKLEQWAKQKPQVSSINLENYIAQTRVFDVVTGVMAGPSFDSSIESTLKSNLGPELIQAIVKDNEQCFDSSQAFILLNLGCLYPFARASTLLDELERLRVTATIGLVFPGTIVGGKLSFFNEDARHYYPAHRVSELREEHLQ